MKKIACLLLFLIPAVGFTQSASKSFINGVTHDGTNITCDLPGDQQFKNVGSKLDGAGMCVFTSIEMAARYAGLEEMLGWRDWCAAKYRGGGWPGKVDTCLADWFKAKSVPPIPYLQYEGTDPAKILDLCDKTRRIGCITYGYSPRYGSLRSIQHMTCNVMLNGKYGVVLDNNFIGENAYEWVERDELIKRTIYPNTSAWIFVWLHQPPPPAPKNKEKVS